MNAKTAGWVAVFVLVGAIVAFAPQVLLIFFAGILVAVCLRGAGDWIAARLRISEGKGLLIMILAILGGAGLTLWQAADDIADQIDDLTERLPGLISGYVQRLQEYQWGRWMTEQIGGIGPESPILEQVIGMFGSVGAGIVYLIVMIFLGIYLAAEPERYRNGVLDLLPEHWRESTDRLFQVTASNVRGWFIGQGVSMAFLGAFAYIGLTLMGIPLALILALLTAIFTFVPNIGPALSMVLPALFGFAESPSLGFYVIIFYVVLQNVEGYLITPLALRHVIYLPPALLLGIQVLLWVLVGFFGVLLAAPLLAVLIVWVKIVYQERVLGEHVQLRGHESQQLPPAA